MWQAEIEELKRQLNAAKGELEKQLDATNAANSKNQTLEQMQITLAGQHAAEKVAPLVDFQLD